MTRKTQIGLLTAACVLCCAGVFLGARLSNRSHAAAEPPMTIEPPDLPTPIISDSGPPKPAAENKDQPTIVAAVETPPPPDLPGPDSVQSTKGKKATPIPDAGIDDPLPPLPSRKSAPENTDPEILKSASKLMPRADVVTVAAEQSARNDKLDVPPPPPPPNAGARDPMLDPAPTDLAPPKPGTSPPPAPIGRELTEKKPAAPLPVPTIPPSTPAPISDGPLPSTSSGPYQALPPSTVKPSTPEPPISTAPRSADPPTSANPTVVMPDRNTPPPARIVPVSPTSPESAKVTPVIKKPAGRAKTLPMTGTHACKMDRDHGVTLPKEVRDQLGEQDVLFITLGTDHSVWVTTAAGLEKLADRLEKTPDVDDETKVIRRRYFAQTERVTLDKSGHIVLPAALADAAGLTQDAVLIGVGDHLELWDAERWQKVSQPATGRETTEPSAADSHGEL